MKTTGNRTRCATPWKPLAAGALATGLLLAGGQAARAGDRDWATAGKILTGVVIADVLFNHLPAANCATQVVETRVVTPCPPPPVQVVEYRTVYAPPPPPVHVVEYRTVYAPAPVCMPRPVYLPAPVRVVQRYDTGPGRGWHRGWDHGRGNPHGGRGSGGHGGWR